MQCCIGRYADFFCLLQIYSDAPSKPYIMLSKGNQRSEDTVLLDYVRRRISMSSSVHSSHSACSYRRSERISLSMVRNTDNLQCIHHRIDGLPAPALACPSFHGDSTVNQLLPAARRLGVRGQANSFHGSYALLLTKRISLNPFIIG